MVAQLATRDGAHESRGVAMPALATIGTEAGDLSVRSKAAVDARQQMGDEAEMRSALAETA